METFTDRIVKIDEFTVKQGKNAGKTCWKVIFLNKGEKMVWPESEALMKVAKVGEIFSAQCENGTLISLTKAANLPRSEMPKTDDTFRSSVEPQNNKQSLPLDRERIIRRQTAFNGAKDILIMNKQVELENTKMSGSTKSVSVIMDAEIKKKMDEYLSMIEG